MDYNWARERGLIRKPASFITSISDELGQELLYAGIPISEVFRQDMGIIGVLSLLWFQRRLPPYACKFLEMCLMITADHGPSARTTPSCAPGRGGAAQRTLRPTRRQVHGQEKQLIPRRNQKVDENYSQNPYQPFLFLSAKKMRRRGINDVDCFE